MRHTVSFEVSDIVDFKRKMLQWAGQFEEILWLDSNDHSDPYGSFDALLAAEAESSLKCNFKNAFSKLKTFRKDKKDWIFGYFGYDLKNDIESLSSQNYDALEFPDLLFFQPRRIIKISGYRAEFSYLEDRASEIQDDYEAITGFTAKREPPASKPIKIRMRIFKDRYFEQLKRLLSHIQRGDVYEANFCQEFYMEDAEIDPLLSFQMLNKLSYPPFAAYLKAGDRYLLSASPERYLQKKDTHVVSQPIKGTAKRSAVPSEDQALVKALKTSVKERAENIMIVDLVRNDLSKVAVKGSVRVEELCEVYSFAQVHQMISTISAKVPLDIDPVEIIEATFPMGSMTGAPKIAAMKIAESLEASRRGLYSGAVGYFTPEGDFDFNVVIRSILYNDALKYVSYSVGGAITAKAEPEKEYEECLLKAKAMRQVLENG